MGFFKFDEIPSDIRARMLKPWKPCDPRCVYRSASCSTADLFVIGRREGVIECIDPMMVKVFDMIRRLEESKIILSSLYGLERVKNLDLEDVFDLSSQLDLLLSSIYTPGISSINNRKLSKKEIRMMVEVLNTLDRFYKLAFAAGLHRPLQPEVLKVLKSQLIECCTLLSPDPGSSNTHVSTNDETSLSVLKLIALPLDLRVQKASTKRWNVALNVSRVVREAANPIPVAGGIISAVFGVATLVLEKRKKKEDARNQARQLLRETSQELELTFQSLLCFRFVLGVANDGTMSVGSVPASLTDKVRTFESLTKDAIRLSSLIQHRSLEMSKNDLYENITNLSRRVSAYKSDLLDSIAKNHFGTTDANQMAQKSTRRTDMGLALAASIFFALVRE